MRPFGKKVNSTSGPATRDSNSASYGIGEASMGRSGRRKDARLNQGANPNKTATSSNRFMPTANPMVANRGISGSQAIANPHPNPQPPQAHVARHVPSPPKPMPNRPPLNVKELKIKYPNYFILAGNVHKILDRSATDCWVYLPKDLPKDELFKFSPFVYWHKQLQYDIEHLQKSDPDPYDLRSIIVESVTKSDGRISFLKMDVNVSNSKGKLDGNVFLRSSSRAVLMILQPDDVRMGSDEEKYVVLAEQPRIAVSRLALAEILADKIDDTQSPFKKAAEKIEKECCVTINTADVINMTELTEDEGQYPMYVSPGGCNEDMDILLKQASVPRGGLDKLKGKYSGDMSVGKNITLRIVPLETLAKVAGRDMKTFFAITLYEVKE